MSNVITDNMAQKSLRKQMRPWVKKLMIVLILIGSVIVFFVGIGFYMNYSMEPLIYDSSDIHEVSHQPIAIVFGAAVNPRTELPSDILADRIMGAVDLYKEGKVDMILMSGDNRVTHYNEPEVMRLFAVARGVPDEAIVLDYAGRRTYDTCYRAKYIFGIDEAVLVTQRYHLYRALYTCRGLGVDVVGLDAVRQEYVGQGFYNVREFAAQIVAFFQVNITRPEAAVMGDRIDFSL